MKTNIIQKQYFTDLLCFLHFFKALDELISKGLPLILVTVGQQHLLSKFSYVKAYFLVSVAATINCVPENSVKTIYHGLISERSKANLPNLKGNFLFYFLLVFLSPLSPTILTPLPIIHMNSLVYILPYLDVAPRIVLAVALRIIVFHHSVWC